jgi:hypothetical protein
VVRIVPLHERLSLADYDAHAAPPPPPPQQQQQQKQQQQQQQQQQRNVLRHTWVGAAHVHSKPGGFKR